MVHVDPFHASARGIVPLFGPSIWPTASHEVAVLHETALRLLLTGPGVGCAAQEVPFHIATFSPVGPSPTTSQKLADRTRRTRHWEILSRPYQPTTTNARDPPLTAAPGRCERRSTIALPRSRCNRRAGQ
jgi:hypothetical protein